MLIYFYIHSLKHVTAKEEILWIRYRLPLLQIRRPKKLLPGILWKPMTIYMQKRITERWITLSTPVVWIFANPT